MKRKEAIKQIQEGKIQVCNDLLPSTKEIKKFLKEAFPEDKMEENNTYILNEFFRKDSVCYKLWFSSNNNFNLPVINISTITKRKKTKLKQLEKQFSELAKDVAEIRQSLAKDVEVVLEDGIDWSIQDLFIYEKGSFVVCSNGKQNTKENTFEGKVIYSTGTHKDVNTFSENWFKSCFKKFKGELTMKN